MVWREQKQPVSIDGIEFDALIDQSVDYSAEVPEYPTEKGFSVSDTIVLKPETISMTLFVTDTPVTWKQRFGSGSGRVQNVVKQLEELYFSKKVITIVTSDAVYDNMAITSISIAKNTSAGYAREIPISFKKIVVTESSTVTIPDSYGKSGASSASARERQHVHGFLGRWVQRLLFGPVPAAVQAAPGVREVPLVAPAGAAKAPSSTKPLRALV